MAESNKRYVSGISLLDTREILNKVVDIQNVIGLTDMFGALKRYTPVTQTIFHNYVNKPLWVVGVSTGTITGSGTATLTFDLTSGTSGYARKNDMVRLEDGTVGYISAITEGASDNITIKSTDGTNMTHSTGQSVYFFSNAVGESSAQRTNKRFDLTKYYQLIQIFREDNIESDLNQITLTEVEWDGDKRFCQKDLIEKWLKLKAEVNAAAWQSKISASQFTTTTSAIYDPSNTDNIMQFQRGIDQYISSYGVKRDADSLGTCDLDDVGKLIDLFIANKAELDFIMCGANKAMRPLSDHLKGLGSSGVTSAQLNVDGQEVNFNVEKFEYSDARFQKVPMPILNHPEVTAPDIKKYIYFLPTGKVKAQSSREGAAVSQSRIQMRYMKVPGIGNQMNQGNAIWGEFHSGAASPVTPSGTKMNWETFWQTYQAVEVLGAEHCGRMKTIS